MTAIAPRLIGGLFALAALLASGSSLADELQQLTRDGRLKRDPVFLPGGEEIVYAVDETSDLIRLLKLNLATGKSTRLHPDASKSETEACFSADGRYHAYSQSTGNLSLRLVIRDGKKETDKDIRPQGRGGIRSPAFAPDSSRLFYCFAESSSQQIYSVKPDASDRQAITRSRGMNNWPSFTPDGKTMVFASSRDGDYEIYSVRLDDLDAVRRLTNSRRQDIRPRVSPDGKRIAFTSTRDGNHEIYVISIDGQSPRRLTANDERDDYASWSPDGSQLLFVSEKQGSFDLYLMTVK